MKIDKNNFVGAGGRGRSPYIYICIYIYMIQGPGPVDPFPPHGEVPPRHHPTTPPPNTQTIWNSTYVYRDQLISTETGSLAGEHGIQHSKEPRVEGIYDIMC